MLTQYPVAQKLKPVILLVPNTWRCILIALLPLINPTVFETLNFGGILRHKWIWSGIAWPSSNSIPFCLHRSLIMSPIFSLIFPYILLCRYLDTKTICYLHSHRTCDYDYQSFIGSSSCPFWGLSQGKNLFITSFSLRNGQTFGGRTGIARGLI